MQHFNVITTANSQSRVIWLAVVLALVLHVFLFLLLEGFFKPRAYLADQTSYQVALVSRAEQAPLNANSEVIEENLRDEQEQLEEPAAKDTETFTSEPAKPAVAENRTPSSPVKPTPVSIPNELAAVQIDKAEAAPEQLTSTEFKRSRVKQSEAGNSQSTVLESELAETKPAEPAQSAEERTEERTEESTELSSVKGAAQTLTPTQASPSELRQKQPQKQPQEKPQEQLREPQFLIGSPDNPKPVYPQRALNRGWEGDVVLGVHVDANGLVTYVEILETSNVSVLDFAAYSTVKDNWRFTPADEEERDLRGFVTVPISFRIN
jgi:protein TonB